MGHIRLGYMPRTREWTEVVQLLVQGASANQVAVAAIRAVEDGLKQAASDAGVVATVRLLLMIPHAARNDPFSDSLAACSVRVPSDPSFMDVLGGFSDALDAAMPNNRGRTDLGEMAQMAAAETLAATVGAESTSLYGASPDAVRQAFAGLATVNRFGLFARMFFARFTFKTLDYFLSRAAADHVGEGRRFTTLDTYAEFSGALELHCKEAARYVEQFSGEWASRENYETGGTFGGDLVPRFIGGAMNKLVNEFKRGVNTRAN
jgi:hypothetical protein